MTTNAGRTLGGPSRFTVTLAPDNQGVLLRRRSDQVARGQRASVYVDGAKIPDHDWYAADGNPNFRWLEDEFLIPASYTKGKHQIHLRIEPVITDGKTNWNESSYSVFSLKTPRAD